VLHAQASSLFIVQPLRQILLPPKFSPLWVSLTANSFFFATIFTLTIYAGITIFQNDFRNDLEFVMFA